ncbi:MFS transporter [Spirulina major CS-329]|uniref:MFS transporter n=1 Tax=Spirulina TaxID=1154 RepID=UPI00232C1CF5|nr:MULTISPECIES: MFS transporter [Spirulina]MDB9493228.1 MFS transporter [Spirulina subsalsa CS-330]MDB9505069.1 MFS transporter [Spirulina major CS-329]
MISKARVLGVTAVQGAITLGWVLYALYLPQLLTELGLAPEWAGLLLTIEHGLEVVIEPLVGRLSDRSQRKLGTRYPWIVVGSLATATLLMGFPAVVVWGQAVPMLLIGVAIAWASAMAVFRSPVMSLLATAAPRPQLPLAASALTLVQQLIGALRFTVYGVILSWGPGFAFGVGSVVLLGAIAFLRWAIPPQPDQPQPVEPSPTALTPLNIALIVAVGLTLSVGLRFIFATIPMVVALGFSPEQKAMGSLAFSLTLAIAALPVGYLATRWGNGVTMVGGAGVAALGLVIMLGNPQPLIVILGVAIVAIPLSGVLNGAIPFVLNLVPATDKGFGLGLYFGALGGGFSFFDLVFKALEPVATVQGTGGAIALLCVAGLIGYSQRQAAPQA